MSSNDPNSASIEIAITPGEKVQNWLATRGIGEYVPLRDFYHPEPPAGLWSLVNGGIAVASLVAFLGFVGFVVFNAVPALFKVQSF